jgi:PKD repeat protein
VLVNGSGISESSGFLYSQASGLTVTVSGSYSGSKQIHNASIDFCEGVNSYSGGLSVVNNNFSASHTYSYPGIYSITTRVQDIDGSVNMERFRLNLASGLAGVNLGGISASGSPTSGLINSENYLTVSFSASGASGLSPSTPSDSNLHWRFGNNSTSQKQSPRTNYAQPGNYVPVVIYKNTTASGIVYLTDSIKVGIND